MPELKCDVQTCMHNKNSYCDLNTIQVGGNFAKVADETCCDSFEERKSGTYSNAAKDASPMSKVECKAVDCKYNDNCTCHAEKINVAGNKACHCGETECATFCCER